MIYMIPLSRLGISTEEKNMLATRLFPEANEIFLKTIAEKNKIDYNQLEMLDYAEHPVWKMEKLFRNREEKAEFLKKVDTSKWNYPYKTIEEAREKDKTSTHILLEDTAEKQEDLNERIERLVMELGENSDDEKIDDSENI